MPGSLEFIAVKRLYISCYFIWPCLLTPTSEGNKGHERAVDTNLRSKLSPHQAVVQLPITSCDSLAECRKNSSAVLRSWKWLSQHVHVEIWAEHTRNLIEKWHTINSSMLAWTSISNACFACRILWFQGLPALRWLFWKNALSLHFGDILWPCCAQRSFSVLCFLHPAAIFAVV